MYIRNVFKFQSLLTLKLIQTTKIVIQISEDWIHLCLLQKKKICTHILSFSGKNQSNKIELFDHLFIRNTNWMMSGLLDSADYLYEVNKNFIHYMCILLGYGDYGLDAMVLVCNIYHIFITWHGCDKKCRDFGQYRVWRVRHSCNSIP